MLEPTTNDNHILDLSLPLPVLSINANADSGTLISAYSGSVDILSNDTYNSQSANIHNVTISLTGTVMKGSNPVGTVAIQSGVTLANGITFPQ